MIIVISVGATYEHEIWSDTRPLPEIGDTIEIVEAHKRILVEKRKWVVEEVTAAGETFWKVILYGKFI